MGSPRRNSVGGICTPGLSFSNFAFFFRSVDFRAFYTEFFFTIVSNSYDRHSEWELIAQSVDRIMK